MMRRLLLVTAAAIASVTLTLGGAWWLLERPGPPLASPVTLTVAEGSRFADAATTAARAGVLRHPTLLTWFARLSRRDRQLHWGEFQISTPLSPLGLLARLTGPPDPVHQVTIPEGFTMRQALAVFEAAGFGAAESFRCVLEDAKFLEAVDLPATGAEGYLFPDTYAFPLATPPERVLRAMVQQFRAVTGPTFARRAADLGFSVHEAVTLASLVEEETQRADERRLVAAVFVNRLRRGMPLQSDPTVIYGRTDDDRRITRADLQRATPYNTYVIRGLPPSPIANPGRAALDAAVDPAPVDYLYFVARGDGSHQFSSTLAEHNAAVNRYQRRGR